MTAPKPIPKGCSYSMIPSTNQLEEGFDIGPEYARRHRRLLLPAFGLVIIASLIGYVVGSRRDSKYNSGLLGMASLITFVPEFC